MFNEFGENSISKVNKGDIILNVTDYGKCAGGKHEIVLKLHKCELDQRFVLIHHRISL